MRKSDGFRNEDRTYSMFACDLHASEPHEKIKHPSRRDFKVNEIGKNNFIFDYDICRGVNIQNVGL